VLIATNGPHTGEAAIRAARFALEHATRLVLLAVHNFANDQLGSTDVGPVQSRITDLEAAVHRLAQDAISQYGADDPFPGRW
jgi:hypothetical protein